MYFTFCNFPLSILENHFIENNVILKSANQCFKTDNQITGAQFNKDEWNTSYSLNVNSLRVKSYV